MFEKTKMYRFLSWLKGEYQRHQERQVNESNFRYFGKNASVSSRVQINKPERVILKEGARIQPGVIINSMGGLYVGRYSGIGYNCVIFTVDHRYRKADAIPFDNHVFLKPVIIRDFVWIGTNVKIMPGVEIGEGAIVGMGAVVTRSVESCSIVIGNPAKIVGFRNKEQFEELKAKGDFSLVNFHGVYEEILFPLSKRRFPKECEELGL
ncbi:MAG TPA: acyltransferase [Desulfobacterales bacterium]|nr:acyltransferase [Desulfobacterales bacterium]HIP38201.1 acyltransferase [Desulfocapsa sulfexigens]